MTERDYVWESDKLFFEGYPTILLRCKHCGHTFNDKEEHFVAFGDRQITVCESCSHELTLIQDYDPKGSREPCTKNWAWMRRLALVRDHYRCRICGEPYDRGKKGNVEVHHIIPQKVGGTHALRNLITLCLKHHQETFINDHAGLEITDHLVKIGKQQVLGEESR